MATFCISVAFIKSIIWIQNSFDRKIFTLKIPKRPYPWTHDHQKITLVKLIQRVRDLFDVIFGPFCSEFSTDIRYDSHLSCKKRFLIRNKTRLDLNFKIWLNLESLKKREILRNRVFSIIQTFINSSDVKLSFPTFRISRWSFELL